MTDMKIIQSQMYFKWSDEVTDPCRTRKVYKFELCYCYIQRDSFIRADNLKCKCVQKKTLISNPSNEWVDFYFSFSGKAVIMCQSSKKEFFKKFLFEPLPVEVRFFKNYFVVVVDLAYFHKFRSVYIIFLHAYLTVHADSTVQIIHACKHKNLSSLIMFCHYVHQLSPCIAVVGSDPVGHLACSSTSHQSRFF